MLEPSPNEIEWIEGLTIYAHPESSLKASRARSIHSILQSSIVVDLWDRYLTYEDDGADISANLL